MIGIGRNEETRCGQFHMIIIYTRYTLKLNLFLHCLSFIMVVLALDEFLQQMEAQMEAELAQSKNADASPEDAAATEAAQVAKLVAGGDPDENQTEEEKEAVDSRSIYVGNVGGVLSLALNSC